ncbi:hypothetical protein ML603_08150 [Streptococcus dysgalactiae subsp. equisimilis]|uniref:hypothetical protein n=1 Tax=Streptococcus dysgalactiae TaxID=1334 RepID=UPI001F1446D5|nr:hypothetical protein [Streptococcus dysgalactiae]UMY67842.1 hypothetical protein ML603_08150 [Streptococcus dysgalactiae subsp. equisimilis]
MIKAININTSVDLEITQNTGSERGRLRISREKLVVYPNKNGEVDLDLLLFVDQNYSRFVEYGEKFCIGNCLHISDLARAMALSWIMENMTQEWSVSPYSESFYSSKDIDWGYKPEGSLRVSDHWNFGADGEHCPTEEPLEGWAVCEYRDGLYHLVHKF